MVVPKVEHELVVLLGATATGKTQGALAACEAAGAEIVSMDSMLVYRGMDVGTAKPSPAEQARVPHHGIDLVDPSERYDLQRWLADAEAALDAIRRRGRRALVVGGTGLYLKALVHGLFEGPPVDLKLRAAFMARSDREGGAALHAELEAVDPASARRLHPNDRKRVVRALEVFAQTGRPLSELQGQWEAAALGEGARRVRLVGLERPPADLEARIERRTRAMLAAGWVEEAVRIRADPGFGPTSCQALGYAEVLRFADGELDEGELVESIVRKTRRFSLRQRTWFRRFQEIVWLPAETTEARDLVARFGWS